MTHTAARRYSGSAATLAMAAAFILLSALIVPLAAEAKGRKSARQADIVTVVVKRGDSLQRIARRHGVKASEIVRLNALERPYRLRIGQRLKLRAEPSVHQVRRGENIAKIAKRYGTSTRALIRANDLKAPYRLKVGQKLSIPSDITRPSRAAARRKPALDRARPPVRRSNARSTPGLEVRRKVAGAVLRGSGVAVKRGKISQPPAMSGRGFAWPLRGRLVGRFGTYPGGLRNDGVNIAARAGSVVRAAENGIVAYTGSGVEGFGELLLIKHAGGWMTAYAHNERFLVERGQLVRRGQPIARVGSTGAVLHPQLHFEIRRNNRPVDPLSKLPSRVASR